MPTGKKIGTLVVVVLKARHLRDQHTFYKQDPYAAVRLGGTGKQTNVDPKGGQHPVWDEELHLPVHEHHSDIDDRMLNVSVYSKESKVDELIGEGKVDISETLWKGEFDDWVKLELNGAFRGEIYLEMTYYAAEPPLFRRPSKLVPTDRLSRPPPTPPKDPPSPYRSPQRSPQLKPSMDAAGSSYLQPTSSPHSAFLTPSASSPVPSPPHHNKLLPDVLIPVPVPSPPRQPYVDPTLKNIPFLDVGSPASGSGAPPPGSALHSVPSILRPRNVKSSPIPVTPALDRGGAHTTSMDNPNWRFQRELEESDAIFAAQLAEREGVDVERLRREETDAELARRLAEEEWDVNQERSPVPGGWVG